MRTFFFLAFLSATLAVSGQQQVELKASRHYLNIPVGYRARMKLIVIAA